MCIVLLVFYLSDNIGGLVAHSSRITDSAVLPSIGANLPPGKENLWGLSGTRICWVTHRSERSKLTYQEKFAGYWENLKKAAGVYWVSSNIGLRSPQFLLSAWTITLPSHYLKQRIDSFWFWETFECRDEIFCHILLQHCSTLMENSMLQIPQYCFVFCNVFIALSLQPALFKEYFFQEWGAA